MTTIVNEAMIFAIERHGDQRRKYTGEPYWKHLAEVAGIVATVQPTSQMLAAAWLHDVLEDTPTSVEELHRRFGPQVTELVVGLTDVSRPEDGNRARRKALDRAHLARGRGQVHTIKLADLMSNTGSIVSHDPDFARVYLAEKRALLAVLVAGDEGLRRMAEAVLSGCERQMASLDEAR